MTRGVSFTLIEDDIIINTFSEYGNTKKCYEIIRQYAREKDIMTRSDISYRRRYQTINSAISSAVANQTIKNQIKQMEELMKREDKISFIKQTVKTCLAKTDLVRLIEHCQERIKELSHLDSDLPYCPLCLCEDCVDVTVSQCGHVFCTDCFVKLGCRPIKPNKRHLDCPICRQEWNSPSNVAIMKSNSSCLDCKTTYHKLKL